MNIFEENELRFATKLKIISEQIQTR